MMRIFAMMMTVILLATPSFAGWFSDAVSSGLQRAGERGVEEAVDSSYDGAKNTGKKVIEEGADNQDAGETAQTVHAPEPAQTGGSAVYAAGGSVDIREGQWKITSTMEMPGMPMAIPPQVFTTCVTRENMIPKDNQAQHCDVTESKVQGNKVTWKMQCTQENGAASQSQGEIVYQGSSFAGSVVTDIHDPQGGSMRVTNRMQGSYVGPCPK